MSGISLSLVLASTMFLIHANDKVVGTMRYVIIFAADANIRKEVKQEEICETMQEEDV